MTEKSRAIKVAVVASLAAHIALGWWALCSSQDGQSAVDQPVVSTQRLLVQIIPAPTALPAAKTLALQTTSRPVFEHSVPAQQARRAPAASSRESNSKYQAQAKAKEFAGASRSSNEAQAVTQSSPAQTPAQTPAALNLDASQAVKSVELHRRKSGLAAALDAMQSKDSHVPETRAFTGLAPVARGIVSETIMANGTRLIKFSGGGCMRVVNLASRPYDESRKPMMENC